MISRTLYEKIYCQIWNATRQSMMALHAQLVQNEPLPERTTNMDPRPKQDVFGDAIQQMEIVGDVAIIPVKGKLVAGATGFEKWYYGFSSYEDILADLAEARRMRVAEVRLQIDSPGGTAMGNIETAKAVARFTRHTPVVAQVVGLCCSAAYKLASATNHIMAPQSSIVGSIGSMMSMESWAEAYKAMGIEVNVFASGPFKGMGHPGIALTDEQKAWATTHVNTMADEFKAFVRENRPRVKDESMQGQVFAGRQALAAHLIDEII